MRTHLFVAVNPSAFGEVVFGRRIAAELAARGERAIFLAPRAHHALLDGVAHVELAPEDPCPDRRVREVARAARPDSLILLDALAVFEALALRRRPAAFLERLDARLIALDVWNLPRAGGRIDFGPGYWPIARGALRVERRLLPVPSSALEGDRGLYDALPAAPRLGRRAARRRLGLAAGERAVVMATAGFQARGVQGFAPVARWARALPPLVARALRGLSPRTRVLHVGPRAWPALRRALGERYLRVAPGAPGGFADLVAAADAFLSFNLTASSVGTAIAARVPVVMGTCSRPAGGLHPFHLWPCGFRTFLDPLLDANPYRDTFRAAEVLDGDALRGALAAVLEDAAVADALRDRQERYERAVRRLPSGADAVAAWLRAA